MKTGQKVAPVEGKALGQVNALSGERWFAAAICSSNAATSTSTAGAMAMVCGVMRR